MLLCVAGKPGTRLRDIAACVGLTERATHRLICELEAAGYLTRQRIGRRNFYEVHADAPLRHELERGRKVGELLTALRDRGDHDQAAA